MIIKNGTIYDGIHPAPYAGDLALREGVIAAIGPGLEPVEEERVLDAAGRRVYPGFVDAHSHLGLDGYGMGREGIDYNEMGDIVSAHLRGIDAFNPQDKAIPMACRGGVTTVGTGPGSANVLGGTFFAVKTWGRCVDDMVVKNPVAMKCAFGEDVCKRPKADMRLEALLPVLRREIPLKAHAHRADDICTAIRIAREFDLRLTLEHCTEGHLIADELARAGFPAAVGPTLTNASKIELVNKTFETPGILARAGVQVSIITDHAVIPQHYLPLCAGLAVKAGMDPFAALQAITINPARHLGIDGRVGSLEVGKDADVVVAAGDPMVSDTVIEAVVINGRLIDSAI